MKFLNDNKGLIIFYLCMTMVMAFWVNKVEKDNDRMMYEKSAYVLNDYR